MSAAMDLHEVSSGQLYTWRHQPMSGELTGTAAPVLLSPMPEAVPCFAAVEMTEPEPEPLQRAQVVAEPDKVKSGQIGIELSCGIKLALDVGFDADALATP